MNEMHEQLALTYLTMRDAVERAGFADEIDWQHARALRDLTESEFFRQTAWVILSSGMAESVVRRVFGRVSTAFLDWTSATSIMRDRTHCRRAALASFRHVGKIDAILSIVDETANAGFDVVKSRIEREGVEYLQRFAFLGPATSLHLAKNIGLSVAKPDRHLRRIATVAGVGSVSALCTLISEQVADPVPVVDLVLWRYATLFPDYLQAFS